jgi:hypothetical protein
MRTLLFTLMSVACTAAVSATVYKWVDDDGVIHYSDQPHENAQKVELKAPQTYSAPKAPSIPATSSRNSSRPASSYQSCSVSSPMNDQVFENTSEVTAGVSVQPAVRAGDSVVVTLDGQPIPGVPVSGGQFAISPVDRGTHTIQMTVRDASGATVCSSPAVTFHVHQASIQSPTNPVRPR